MADEIEVRKRRFLTLQKRLKEERLFVKQEKEQLRKLNEKLLNVSQNLFYLEWKNRKQWVNIDRLVSGKANPAECSNTSRLIESIKFEDACSHLNYQDAQYGEVLLKLKENPKLVALILDYCDNKKFQTTTRQLCRLLISTLYGSCAEKRDELSVLKILNELMELQVLSCEDLLQFFIGKRSTDNAFACVFTVFSEMLFSSKLYLTAALHGSVMQVIVDDAIFLDVEVSKVVGRIPPKTALEKFGKPGTSETKAKIDEHMAVLHEHILNLCNKFLKSLHDKIYCFPQSLRWAIAQLYEGMLNKMKLPQANAKAIIGYMLMSYFICPALINPEPYGINSDADISETARHNLGLIASILRSLALIECGLKDEKLKIILDHFDEGKVMSYVTHLLSGATNIPVLELNEGLPEVTKCSLLITEHDLKSLINCLKLLQSYNASSLSQEGLNELLEGLPPPPLRWVKSSNAHDVQTLSSGSNIQKSKPTRPPRLKKVNSSSNNKEYNKEDLEKLKEDLHTMISKEDVVLIIPLGNESEQSAGMLSEEKVLGLTNKLPTSNSFDMDAIEKDISKRAREYMMDALRESFGDTNLLDLSNENLDSISSSPMEAGLLISKETTDTKTEPNEMDFVFFKTPESSNPGNITGNRNAKSDIPVDELICLSDSESSQGPALPEKRMHHKPVSSVFNDEPLIDLAINETHHNSNNRNTSTSSATMNGGTKTMTGQSFMVGGLGGINDILKNAAVPSPTTVKNNEFQAWSPVDKGENPWGTDAVNEENECEVAEEAQGFENNFISSSPEKKQSPRTSKRHSTDPKYSDYADTIQKSQKSPGLRKKFGIDFSLKFNNDDDDGKLARKKSHGAWLKDKISTIGTGLRTSKQRISENNTMEDEDCNYIGGGSFKGAKDFSTLPAKPPTSPRGTPQEASERSKRKSQSFISQLSSEVNISEAIMEKYKKKTKNRPSTHGGFDTSIDLSSATQIDQVLVEVCQEEAVFDDDFKFEDAKRKLRTVFCTADQASIPSDAKSFDHLLLTMLQAKLAEAINLQDRFSVAQLHETLRSIKQLSPGSCEKLIEKLESDYEGRSQYISYLIQTKQGLLSTIAHIEQVTAKMHRDKIICSRYFTTLSVRLFLENQERKRDLAIFAHKFASNVMLDEKCALLNDFLQKLNATMLEESTWSHCTDEQIDDAQVATERAVMSKIFKEAFYPNQLTDMDNDRIFHSHIDDLARKITLTHAALQIPKMYQKEAPWPSAQTELLMVNAYKTAADKLACIHRCCVTIMNLLSMASEKQAPGADDFVPVLVYVVLRANPPNLLSTKQYVNTFYETRLSGEEYYCWMQFCAAVEFIKTLDV